MKYTFYIAFFYGFYWGVDSHTSFGGDGQTNLTITVFKTKQNSPQLHLQRQTWTFSPVSANSPPPESFHNVFSLLYATGMAVFLDTCGQRRKAKHRKIQGKESVSSRQMLSLCFSQRNAFLLYVGSPPLLFLNNYFCAHAMISNFTTFFSHSPPMPKRKEKKRKEKKKIQSIFGNICKEHKMDALSLR